jgi:hypothetical protein
MVSILTIFSIAGQARQKILSGILYLNAIFVVEVVTTITLKAEVVKVVVESRSSQYMYMIDLRGRNIVLMITPRID